MKIGHFAATRRYLPFPLLISVLALLTVGCNSSYNSGGGSTPYISGLSVASGPVGTSVTITGTNFGATQGSSTVTFNGTMATPTSWSATSIVAPVPTGATTGSVVVTVGGKSSNGMTFTVTSAATPTITSLTPNSGPVGTSVTITGTNFGATQGSSTVTFYNGQTAAPTSWSATSIVAPVPTGATTGNVTVTVGGVTSNAVSFTVTTASAPTIASLTPNSGPVGTSVTIAGSNFGASQGSSTVTFNGTAATPTGWSATSITAQVPTGATTGYVVVTVGGVASNGVTFTVTSATAPSITSLSPTSGAVGTSVTITGTNFGATQGSSTVTFYNGKAAAVTTWSAASIVVTVPTGATTGSVTVTVGGVASNGVSFTVTTSGAPVFPIKLSANKRYFVDQNGTPFLMIADAAHHLIPAIPQSSYVQYINDRVANGFNTINIFAVCADAVAGAGNCPINGGLNNGAGALPFTTGTDATNYDLSTANPSYWSQVDAFVTAAANAGLLVVVEPLPWGSDFGTAMKNSLNTTGCTPDGNPATFTCNNYKFGQFLGYRYKNFPNIVWQFGQDFRGSALPDATFITYQSDVMVGVASTDPNHLITCQMNYLRSYTQQAIPIGDPNFNSTVNVSFLYTYYETYDYALAAYNDSHVMPVFQGESNYETANNTNQLNDTKYGKGGTAANAFITRQENWYTMTSGGAGTEFGNQHVNHFDTTSPTWQSQLDTTATLQVKYLPKLFNQLQWWNLVPDQSHKIVTAGSSGTYNASNENLYLATYATAAWVPDSTNASLASAAIVYTPVSTTLTINMGMFSKTMTASWYDPTTGNSTAIPGSFPNIGTQNFMTPSGTHTDGTGTNDWVLVLQ